jgi:UDP-N-acetylmuramate dehydrogenase
LEKFNEKYQFMTEYAALQKILEGKQITTLKEISDVIATIRAKNVPDTNVIGTAGSFFANPFVCRQHFEALKKEYPELPFREVSGTVTTNKQIVKLSAGRLIEKAGLKGYSNGKAGTSPHHALIVINERGNASDVLEVVEHIQAQVKEKFEVELQPEVVYV